MCVMYCVYENKRNGNLNKYMNTDLCQTCVGLHSLMVTGSLNEDNGVSLQRHLLYGIARRALCSHGISNWAYVNTCHTIMKDGFILQEQFKVTSLCKIRRMKNPNAHESLPLGTKYMSVHIAAI